MPSPIRSLSPPFSNKKQSGEEGQAFMRRQLVHIFLLMFAGWVGCSSDRASFESSPGVDFSKPDSAVDNVDAGCSGLICSPDLHSVRDCYGNVVKDCGPDKACGKGECIAPCDAAAINEGSIGCSFAVPWSVDFDYRGSCNALLIANNWTSPATLRIEYKGEERSLEDAVWVPIVEDGVVKHKKLDGPIPAGGAAVVFLSDDKPDENINWVGCPKGVRPVLDKDESIPFTGIGHALFAGTDVPTSMYSIYPYGGVPSHVTASTLLFPTTSFRNNYIAVSTWEDAVLGKPTLQIVATENDTFVDVLPKVKLVGGYGIQPGPANAVTRYTLQRGEVMQLTQANSLVGSVIESSKPVGLFGGMTCVYIPFTSVACDEDNTQIPPVSAWGHEYAVLPPPDRLSWRTNGTSAEGARGFIRIVGAVDDTKLTYDPSPPEGAPAALESGQLVRFAADYPFVVRTQDSAHPVYVASVMTGRVVSTTDLGDPQTALAIPTDQWLDSYQFVSDYTYPMSAVFVTRRKTNGEAHDVTLDCAGPLTGWKPIGGDYEWTYADLSRANQPVSYPDGGACTDGAHRIWSDAPFAMTVWGIGWAVSYSYPGGAGLRPINDVHVPVVH